MYSYSSIKDFKQCPKLFYEKRIAKSVKFVQSAAQKRGERMHKAFEEFVRDGTPLPTECVMHEPVLKQLLEFDGAAMPELAMAVDALGNPVPYYDPDTPDPKPWNFNKAAHIGGVADLVLANTEHTEAVYVDYKTGKGNYPDIEQCELMAVLIMANMPWVQTVSTGLLFVDAGKFITETYKREDFDQLFDNWLKSIERIEYAKTSGVWQARPNNLCKWCAVTNCDERN